MRAWPIRGSVQGRVSLEDGLSWVFLGEDDARLPQDLAAILGLRPASQKGSDGLPGELISCDDDGVVTGVRSFSSCCRSD